MCSRYNIEFLMQATKDNFISLHILPFNLISDGGNVFTEQLNELPNWDEVHSMLVWILYHNYLMKKYSQHI